MADESFRSYRGRDPRDEANPLMREAAADPLAELARLIGQTDPYAERGRDAGYDQSRPGDAPPVLEWGTDERYATEPDYPDEHHYAPPPPPPLPPVASHPAYQAAPAYEDDPLPDRSYGSPPPMLNGYGEGNAPHRHADARGYGPVDPGHDGEYNYVPDEYYDEAPPPRPRTGMVIVMAVLGLAVVGIAGAFAYRTMFGGAYGLGFPSALQAMFGGYSLPSLPPIIKANNGPNKIVPNYGEQPKQAGAGSGGGSSAEKIVSREEQPVTIEPPKVNSRVVSTIPIAPGQNPSPSSGALPAQAGLPPTSAPVAPAAAEPPPAAAGTTTAFPPAVASAAPIVPAAPLVTPVAPAGGAEPKKVHTVTIHTDQSGSADAAPVQVAPTPAAPQAAPPPPKSAPRAKEAAPKPAPPPAGRNAPLSIVPTAEGDVPAPVAPRTRMATTTAPAPAPAASASTGGYAVQVSSQRSEADAQSAYRALRAKFPSQLGAREPIIRRADLGSKGVYYRALVGPFASMEQAAEMCSSLKAAGANCLVQRN